MILPRSAAGRWPVVPARGTSEGNTMTEANWTDLLATIRFIFDHVLQIVTIAVGGAAAYYSYRGKVVGDKNTGRLVQQAGQLDKQDEKIASIDDKVTTIGADPLSAQVKGLTAQLQSIRDEPGPGA